MMSAPFDKLSGVVSNRSACPRYPWWTYRGVILGAWRMQRVSRTARHRFDLLHRLLIAMVAAAVLIVSVGAVELGLRLLIGLD